MFFVRYIDWSITNSEKGDNGAIPNLFSNIFVHVVGNKQVFQNRVGNALATLPSTDA